MNQNKKYDMVNLKIKTFNIMTNRTNIKEAMDQFMMIYWVFDYFVCVMPWKCDSDAEFKKRVIN